MSHASRKTRAHRSRWISCFARWRARFPRLLATDGWTGAKAGLLWQSLFPRRAARLGLAAAHGRRASFESLEDRRLLTVELHGTFLSLGINSDGSLINDAGTLGATFGAGRDFFTPDTQHARFAVSANGMLYTNDAPRIPFSDISMTVVDSSSGSILSALAVGTVFPGLTLSRTIAFDDASWTATGGYVVFYTTFTNTSELTITGVAFAESVDPDQDPNTNSTANDVLFDGAFVRSTATIGAAGLTVGLGSSVPGAAGSVENGTPAGILSTPVDPEGAISDQLIGLAIDFGDLAPGETRTFRHYMVFSTTAAGADQIFAELLNSVPTAEAQSLQTSEDTPLADTLTGDLVDTLLELDPHLTGEYSLGSA